ncbi:hypothetical protein I4F81_008396 [Pyropia yezoensis]|uniref:Uncharacterized protein n=1 Tax=Pyropia yezoensis TaxID=2788 RepID=A0ACC3C7M0_PYRYE|nr:hypothetical protein I4F81_008396 [Neopyropia yezoensis]
MGAAAAHTSSPLEGWGVARGDRPPPPPPPPPPLPRRLPPRGPSPRRRLSLSLLSRHATAAGPHRASPRTGRRTVGGAAHVSEAGGPGGRGSGANRWGMRVAPRTTAPKGGEGGRVHWRLGCWKEEAAVAGGRGRGRGRGEGGGGI